MIEVFKTNIETEAEAMKILSGLNQLFTDYSCNVDLEDCDRILRIESNEEIIDIEKVIELLKKEGCELELLY